ncbi:CDP-alcohol phosphatidyltransferase family protein [Neisseria dentiae]|uniref:CDP-alcohol phosphatidyltransferase family protein n=1 Tax=Neisseria dentiae TaxID=194197 RepID=UPI00211C4CBD|nr:CDP-alcohol phosphatidyltransferase family protein [Neisseria dentiae]MCQ9325456.1 CDP-alcohol phosphatidyltransferase family protein [Neisseria dentiae]
MTTENRRPLSSRNSRFAQSFAHWLAANKVLTPNQISCLGMVFAAIGALLLGFSTQPLAWVITAVMVQLRLLCNLFDGMVAVEGGLKTPAGDLFNELPDRFSDSVLLIALGYAAGWPAWGWLAALLAAGTAYIRVFGGSLGLPQSFRGPMAKQHRMAVLTAACLLGALEMYYWQSVYVLRVALLAVAAGSALTCYYRIRDMAGLLKNR